MVGERIKQARLASGLTLELVAEKMTEKGCPITKQGLSKYERCKSTPTREFMVQLGAVLGVKVAYFFSATSAVIQWLAFRKLSRMPIKAQEAIKAYAARVVEDHLWLQTTLFPKERPNFPQPCAVSSLEGAEELAVALRAAWKLGDLPIDSLTETVEDHGGVVVACGDIRDDFDGLAGRANGDIPVAVVSTHVPHDRRRFNLAHELGHLLMAGDSVGTRDGEKMANRFASALLVPADIARRELGARRRRIELRELGLLKQKYGLSMQGWATRAHDLAIIEQGHYKSICAVFSSRHWRKAEPFHFFGREEPSKLKRMTLRALAECVITAERAEQLCPGCTGEITTMKSSRAITATELRKLPRTHRQAVLADAAAAAQEEYMTNRQLTDFEAFDKDDQHVSHCDESGER
ncbi:MAG TPA: XRE family transcriptional regulator [Pirellulales bacterium]